MSSVPFRIAGAAALLLSIASLEAQGERISLKLTPAPDQTVRIENHQEIQLVGEGAIALALKFDNRATITMKVGARAADGSLTARLDFDDAATTATLNDSPLPVPAPPLKGTSMTVEYAQNGSSRVLESTGALDASVATAMLSGLNGLITPDATIGVGETVSVPTNLSLPLPGASGTALTGNIHLTLAAIEREGDTRLARFEQKMEAAATGPASTPARIAFTGGGTMTWDLTHGLQRDQDVTLNFDVAMNMPGAPPTMKGTMKMTWRGSRVEPGK